jgi:hypothetical protein
MGHMKDIDIRIRSGGNDAIAAVSELLPRWIPVAERLPEQKDDDSETNVLGYYADFPPAILLVWYTGQRWEDGDGSGRELKPPTHWMPLPEPPAA